VSFQVLQPEGVATPQLPLSQVVIAGDLVFLAGQVPFDENGELVRGEFRSKARAAFRNMRLCLEAAGCGFEDVIKVNVFLVDLQNFQTFNEVYAEHFTAPPYPVRSTVLVNLVAEFEVEVEAVARLREPTK
jgi:2-iminobutanoate/2-iminopropanoate deaminase